MHTSLITRRGLELPTENLPGHISLPWRAAPSPPACTARGGDKIEGSLGCEKENRRMGLANEARLHAFSSSTPPSHTRSADASAPAGRTKAHQAEESRSCAFSWFSLHPGPSRSCERLSLRQRRGSGSRPKAGARLERGRSVGARAEVDASARGRALVESGTSLPASPLVGRPGELACDFSKLPTLGAAGRCSSRFSLSSEFCRSGIRQANTRESRAAGTRSAFNPLACLLSRPSPLLPFNQLVNLPHS